MKRVLIVEDEPAIALALEDELVSHGYEVTVAHDGETATTLGDDPAYAAIVLDVMLPGRDGLSVCRALRTRGVKTPILLLTARAQEDDVIGGLRSGADDYVIKPYRPAVLMARLDALLRRAGRDDATRYAVGTAVIDLDRRAVARDGVAIVLTPQEFRVIEVLVRHRDRAVSRQRLIDEAWGRGTFVTDRVVDNQVTNLRKKLEPVPAQPRHIVSVRGYGYRLEGVSVLTER